MTKDSFIWFAFILVTTTLNAQIQYLNLNLTESSDRSIEIDSNSYILYGSIDSQEDSSDHILLHDINKDSSSTIFVNFDSENDNEVFTGYIQHDSVFYYGILFRNDSCYAYTDSVLTFLKIYQKADSFAIVKCETDIQIFLSDSLMYSYGLDTFIYDLSVVAQVHSAPNIPNMLLSYHLYGMCDTLVSPGPEINPLYISLNYEYNRSYAVVEEDLLHLRYFERYHITSQNDTVHVSIFSEDNPHQSLHVFTEENNYGNNFLDLNLTLVPGIQNQEFYMIKMTGSNKNTTQYLRIYKDGTVPETLNAPRRHFPSRKLR